jgi:class 3 adenylate cyclase/tetratricopeptide (TPR) repeat protein
MGVARRDGGRCVEDLSAHLPMDRRQALARGEDLADRASGSVLLADISGFTPLTAALVAAYGPRRGAEETTAVLNRVWDALIEPVDALGGSVIGFSGDAITCWFEADDGRRAAACGGAIRTAMAAFAAVPIPNADPIELTIKVAVAAGPVRRFAVGDPAIRRFAVIAGETVARLGRLEAAAQPGELVVDGAAAAALGLDSPPVSGAGAAEAIVVTRPPAVEPRPWPPIAPGALASAEVEAWVQASIRERLRAGRDDLLAELRPGVSIFVRFGGLDDEADDAGDRLDAYIRRVQAILEPLEGLLVDITFGDKGSYLSIVFGAPVAHEDDPYRAARAALELRAAPPGDGGIGPAQVGISRGRICAGAFGGRTRRTYGIVGGEVNVAARLMQGAEPGRVIVSDRVARAIAGRLETRALAPVRVKGLDEPLAIHELVGEPALPAAQGGGRRRRPRSDRPIVGRAAELATLSEALDAVAAGGARTVAIRGEPGVGKSRLVEAALDAARGRGLRILAGAASPIDRATPYLVWEPVFASILGTAGRPLGAAELAAAIEPLEPGERAHATLLGAVVRLDVGEPQATARLSPEARQDRTRSLLAALFDAHRGPEPTVLVVDDVQWADSASRALVDRVARLGRILVLLAARPETGPAGTGVADLLAGLAATTLELTPLERTESLEVVARALGVTELPAEIERFILRRAQGHPFYSLELAYALRDAELLELDGGRARLAAGAELDGLEFPESIEGVIGVRVDRLPVEAQEVLKVASVVGPAFSAAALAEVRAAPPGPASPGPASPGADGSNGASLDALAVRLADLVAVDLIAAEPAHAGPPTYAFRHVLIRDAVYNRLLYAQRRQLHRRAAEHFERTGEAAGVVPHGLLAHHWEQAEVPDRAIDHLEVAATGAHRDGAFLECASFLDRAFALGAGVPPERRAGWAWLGAQAHYRLGSLDRSRELAEAAVAVLDRPIPIGGARLGFAVGRQVIRQLAHRLVPGRFLDRAPEADRARLRRAVRALFNLAEVYYLASLQSRSAYAALRGLNLAERGGPSGELVEAYGAITIIAGLVGRHGLAERYAGLGRAAATAVDESYATAIHLHQVGLYRSGTGPAEPLLADWARAADRFRPLGDKGRLRDCIGLAGVAAYLFGRLDLAQAYLAELVATHDDGERSLPLTWARAWLGAIELRRGRPEAALEHLRAAAAGQVADRLDITSVSVHGLTALALHRLGSDAEARAAAERARAIVRATGGRPTSHAVLDGYVALAELALAWWDGTGSAAERAMWRARAGEAVRDLATYASTFPIGRPARRRFEAEVAGRLGQDRRAVRAWRTSLEAALALDLRHDAALARAGLAGRLRGDDPERATLAADALVAFAAMGMPVNRVDGDGAGGRGGEWGRTER